MATSSYLQHILTAFSEMDIDRLQFLLKDNYSYQDTTKEIFLGEIQKIFEAHKNSEDTELMVWKGKCGSSECDNCGTGGYRFIGNRSLNYFDLLFVCEGDDVKDIFYCSEFKTDRDCGQLNSSASIWINQDDLVTFEKTPEYWAKLNASLAAYDELITSPRRTFSMDEIAYWLEKHLFNYDRIGGYDVFQNVMKWTPFAELYYTLNELVNFIVARRREVKKAVEEMARISDEPSLIAWLLKYEDMYNEMSYPVKYGYMGADVYNLISDDSVRKLKQYIDFCSDKHTAMLCKYSIYTQEEESEFYKPGTPYKDTDFLRTLKFHLAKREEVREMGINISLNILFNESGSSDDVPGEIVPGDVPPF